MSERKITFPGVGTEQGSRVWRNAETGVEIIRGKNFKEAGLYYVCVPTLDEAGRMVIGTATTLAQARVKARVRAEYRRDRIATDYTLALLEDSDRNGERPAAEREIEREREIEARASMNPAWNRPVHYRSPEIGYQACGEAHSSDGITEARSEVTCQRCRDRYRSDYPRWSRWGAS